jgi:muramoyltetrapeptide carboxypeptidase
MFHKGLALLDKFKIDHAILTDSAVNLFKAESKSRHFLAGPDQDKVDAFEGVWNDYQAKDVLCVRGGYGNLRLLPLLDDVELKPLKEKKIWGYSDTTIIQHYLFNRFGSAWVHSPMLTSPSFTSPNSREKAIWTELLKGRPVSEKHRTHKLKIKNGKWSGSKSNILLGGNLVSLVSMIGTPWEPISKEPFYLFIEEIDEAGRRLDRALQTLVHSLFFEGCQGVILGHLTKCENGQKIVELWAKEYGLPLAAGLPAGHDRPNIPILMGSKVQVSPSKSEVTLKTPSFSLRC